MSSYITKKRFRRWGASLIGLALVMSACGGDDDSADEGSSPVETEAPATTAAEDESTTTAAEESGGESAELTGCLLAPASDTPYSSRINAAIAEGAAAAGIDMAVLSAEGDLQRQADQMNDCISRGVDGIMVIAVDGIGICPSLQAANDAGIPVLGVNSGVDSSCEDLLEGFTGPNYLSQAAVAADLANELLGGEGQVAIVSGALGFQATIERTDGFVNRLEEIAPTVVIVEQQSGEWSRQDSQQVARDIITRFGDELDLIYAQDDTMAAGVADALEEAGRAGEIKLIGVGGSEDGFALLDAGVLDGTIYQSPVFDGELAVETFLKMLNGEEFPFRQEIDTPAITPANRAEYDPAY